MNRYLALFFAVLALFAIVVGFIKGDINYTLTYSNLILATLYQILAKLHGEY